MFLTVLVEVCETGVLADEAALEFTAGEEHGGGCAVACAAAAVFIDGSAELRVGHEQDPVQEVLSFQICDKGAHRFRQLLQQGAVIAHLIGVVVEAAESVTAQFGEEDAHACIGADQLGDGSKVFRQLEGRVIGTACLCCLADPLTHDPASVAGGLHKAQQGIVVS